MTTQEAQKECRKLQLQAMLPAEHQRLVKYPMMLELLAKQFEKSKEKSKGKKSDDPSKDNATSKNNKDGSGDEESTNDRTKKISSDTSEVSKSPSNEDSDNNSAFVEATLIKKYAERTREIVSTVDKLVAEAQNIQRLVEIQQGLDVSGLDKFPDSPITIEYRVSIRIFIF